MTCLRPTPKGVDDAHLGHGRAQLLTGCSRPIHLPLLINPHLRTDFARARHTSKLRSQSPIPKTIELPPDFVMKKPLFLALCASALIGCCWLPRRSAPIGSALRGTWSGEAHFLDLTLATEYGVFAVTLTIDGDDVIGGSVGSAKLVDAELESRPEEWIVHAKLEGDVFEQGSLPEQGKDLVVFILSEPTDSTTSGNLHLKSNSMFDFTMRVCGIELARAP